MLAKIPDPERAAALIKLKRELYDSSLFCLAKYGLGLTEMTPATHSRMCNVLQSPSRRKLVVMPRGTFKTSVASVAYPVSMLLKNPNLRVLLDSELYSNSKNILREIKQRTTSAPFTDVYPSWLGPVWNEGEIVISQRTVVKKEASITCSGIGAQKTGQHYDVIIADDMNSPKNSHTPEGCERVIQHYRYYTSLLEPDGVLVVIGTRYSANDLIGFILSNELGITNEQEYFG